MDTHTNVQTQVTLQFYPYPHYSHTNTVLQQTQQRIVIIFISVFFAAIR